MPYLQEFSQKLHAIDGLSLEVVKVVNNFFGPTVTVAGLLTGKDIVKTIAGKVKADCLLVPDVALKYGADVFLDNVTLKDVEECLGMNVTAIDPTPEGLLKGITDGCKWEN
jgi:NifB/MoaA-like Fe-S oxidoreductase